MYSEELNRDTASVLDNDLDHINSQMGETSNERKTLLYKIAGLQVFTMLTLMIIDVPLHYNWITLPMLVGSLLLSLDLGISKLNAQKAAKYLFYYGLGKSGFLFLMFVLSFIDVVSAIEIFVKSDGPYAGRLFVVSIINMAAEGASTLLLLRVVRLTNEVIGLLNRKLSRGIAEVDFRYEC